MRVLKSNLANDQELSLLNDLLESTEQDIDKKKEVIEKEIKKYYSTENKELHRVRK